LRGADEGFDARHELLSGGHTAESRHPLGLHGGANVESASGTPEQVKEEGDAKGRRYTDQDECSHSIIHHQGEQPEEEEAQSPNGVPEFADVRALNDKRLDVIEEKPAIGLNVSERKHQ